MVDKAPSRSVLWTPGPWEVRYFDEDSAEYEDGLRAWVANHRRKEYIADVVDARNGPIIAAAPDLVGALDFLSWSAVRYYGPDLAPADDEIREATQNARALLKGLRL